jgi:hypothetical protein
MTRPTFTAWAKRIVLATALVCLGGAMAAKPADAQISVQLPFVSLGIGYPSYYPYYYRANYGGWRHRNWCYWHPYRCGYY